MHDQLVGYLLKALDEEELWCVEQLLRADEQARQQIELLRRALIPLESDPQDDELPLGLAARTCECIRRMRQKVR